jgi:hypothetical protein
MNLDDKLKKKRISLFDDVNDKMKEGIRKNIEDMGNNGLKEMEKRNSDNVKIGKREVKINEKNNKKDKKNEENYMEFVRKYYVV